jgi:molecular chaperone Hsp31 and glyoxalase 3
MTGLPAPDAAEDKVHKDRRLLTGDSPLASNNPGKLAAETPLADVAAR